MLRRFNGFNIVDILKKKVSDVDGYIKLCTETIYNNDIYGHTPNEKIKRCDPNIGNSGTTKYFIDRQYSIYEIIKNTKINYNDIYQQLTDNIINNINNKLKHVKRIVKMICGLIYYYCIQNKFILLDNRTTNDPIYKIDKSIYKIKKTELDGKTNIISVADPIDVCIIIYNQLSIRNCNIYYSTANKYATTTNMYIAQIFSLCYRFNNMYGISEQKNNELIEHNKQIYIKYLGYSINYQLFEPINLTYLKCDVTQNDEKKMITQITF